ncbi:MAG: RNA polymerase sigma factor RpoE [Phycisphaeraceae bacterium]|nr:MAG: RNA polymerase sigma factor RpoE [Phycisphaeraceae bacterium]
MERTPDQIETEMLVLRVQAGDRGALDELFRRWNGRLTRHAARLVGADLAPEAAQNAWVGIVRGVGSLADPARFGAWAYRLVSNKSADLIRKAQRDRRLVRRVGERTPRDGGSDAGLNRSEGSDDQEMQGLRRAIRSLPDDHRVVMLLHYVDGMSTHEIGRALGVPAGTVKSRLFHARAKVRAQMDDAQTEARDEQP